MAIRAVWRFSMKTCKSFNRMSWSLRRFQVSVMGCRLMCRHKRCQNGCSRRWLDNVLRNQAPDVESASNLSVRYKCDPQYASESMGCSSSFQGEIQPRCPGWRSERVRESQNGVWSLTLNASVAERHSQLLESAAMTIFVRWTGRGIVRPRQKGDSTSHSLTRLENNR